MFHKVRSNHLSLLHTWFDVLILEVEHQDSNQVVIEDGALVVVVQTVSWIQLYL